MELKDGIKTFHAENAEALRGWFLENHAAEKSVWLIFYNKNSSVPSVTYDEAVNEALCFGWIDSKPNKRDEQSRYQFFSQRKPKSNWSAINKAKVERLTAEGKMTAAGQRMVDLAKATGTWTALEIVDNLVIAPDLEAKLREFSPAFENFHAFSKTTKKGILEWIMNAKTAPTREKRILETATLAQKGEKANQYVKKN